VKFDAQNISYCTFLKNPFYNCFAQGAKESVVAVTVSGMFADDTYCVFGCNNPEWKQSLREKTFETRDQTFSMLMLWYSKLEYFSLVSNISLV